MWLTTFIEKTNPINDDDLVFTYWIRCGVVSVVSDEFGVMTVQGVSHTISACLITTTAVSQHQY